ncbi:hypothetical protein BH10BAC5_BH10BAC5_27860 [soil metagenome]
MKKIFYLFISALLFFCVFQNSYATKYTITVQSFSFNPDPVNAFVGDTLHFVWVNGNHTTTCDPVILPGTSHPAGALDWDSPMNAGSPTFDYVLTKAGTYTYGCQPHWPTMSATINVTVGYKYWAGSNGGGDGSSWSDPLNWLDGTVPVTTDSVKLDNSFYAFTYVVTLPGGVVNTQVANIKIYPTLPNFIYLTLPSTNTSTSGALILGDGIGSPYDFSISKHGVFNYQTGAGSGTPFQFINSVDSIQLLDSSMWNHNCTVGQTGLANKLSKASNTRTGIFRYDMKTTSFASIQFSNITYGCLQLLGVSAAAPYPGKKYITTGASACNVRGDFYMDASCYDSTTMTNNLNIGGDFYSYGKFVYAPVASPRTIVFNGTTLQNIYCAGSGSLISGKITFNNSAGFMINNPFYSDTVNMTNGNINSIAGAWLGVGYETANSGFLNRTAGIVTGQLERWYLAGTTSAALDFPVGTSTTLKTATCSFSSAPTTAGRIGMKYIDNGDGATDITALNDAGFSVTRRSNSYWLLTGTFLTGGLVNLTFDGNGQSGITDPANLRVIWSNDGSIFSLLGVHAAGSGTIGARNNVNNYFSNFYLAGNTATNPLPVELSSFLSTTIKNEVILDWVSSHEQNNSKFEIERANLLPDQSNINNDLKFERAGTVQGNGNSNISHSYRYADHNLSSGRYAYRLKQIDYNGDFRYFLLNNEVTVTLPVSINVSQNYPNPFNPSTKINYEMPFDGAVKITVFDNTGKEIKDLINGNVAAGYYSIDFNAAGLSSGIYFYRVYAAAGPVTYAKVFKMMVVK